MGKHKESMQVDFPKFKGPLRIWYPRHLASRILFHLSPHSYLFVNFCKLFQVVLKKGNLLLLGVNPPTVLGLHFCTLIKDRGKDGAVLKPNRSHPDQAKPAPQETSGWRNLRTGGEDGGWEEPERGWHSLS